MSDDSPDDFVHTGHDLHFLSRLSRVELDQTELALRLYRTPELVRALFSDSALPGTAERVALPLGEGEGAPHVILARGGAFVTCLGAGMSIAPHPALPWERLAAHLRRDDARLARERRMDDATNAANSELFHRVATSGPRLSREDFRVLEAVQPLLLIQYLLCLCEAALGTGRGASEVVRVRLPPRATDRKFLQGYWGSFYAMGHLALLAGAGGRVPLEELRSLPEGVNPCRLLLNVARFGQLGVAVRAMWSLARAGKMAFPYIKDDLNSVERRKWLAAVLALAAIASGQRGLRAEALGILSAARMPTLDGDGEKAAELARGTRHLIAQLLDVLPDDPDAIEAKLAQIAQQSEERQDWPVEACAATILSTSIDFEADANTVTAALYLTMLAARLPAERFYAPSDQVHWLRGFEPSDAVYLARLNHVVPEPVRAEARPGRNQPCTCGSGKKYKRCCGASTAARDD